MRFHSFTNVFMLATEHVTQFEATWSDNKTVLFSIFNFFPVYVRKGKKTFKTSAFIRLSFKSN